MTKIPPRWPCGVDERRLIYHHTKESHLVRRVWSELPRLTALGPPRLSLVEVGGSRFCVGVYIRRGHSIHEPQRVSLAHQNAKRSGDGSRLRRRLVFTGGSECHTPTDRTLGHNRRCALLVVGRKTELFGDNETAKSFRTTLEHHRRRGEHRTPPFDRRGSKGWRTCEQLVRALYPLPARVFDAR